MGAKILLVDDEPGVLRSLERLLRQDGHEVLTAGDGARALHLLREHVIRMAKGARIMRILTKPWNRSEFLGARETIRSPQDAHAQEKRP